MKYATSLIRPTVLAVGIASLLSLAAVTSVQAAVTYIGDAIIPGNGTDQSGLNGAILEDGVSPNNALNGIGSGLGYAGGNLFYALGDRGPNKVVYPGGAAVDNTTSYPCRYQKFNINLTPVGSLDGNGHYPSYTVNATNVGTTLLKNYQGAQYLGISTGFTNNTRLDCEAIRVAPDGTSWVSDEYGPFILHFNKLGQQIGSLPLPPGFQIPNPGPTLTYETANDPVGRTTNKGMEGLALSPDGKTLVGMMQGPLAQDGGANGTNVRILVYDLTNPNAAPKQYLYQLDTKLTPISELLAINSHEFLVDERDGVVGAAGIKKLYRFDLNQGNAPTDLATSAYSGVDLASGLPTTGTPVGVVPLQKTLFADIGQILNSASPSPFSAVNGNNALPDKLEGYAWGPDLADGRHLLLCTNDNDFIQPGGAAGSGFPNYIFAFAVDAADVPNFQQASFDAAVALNSIDHIVVVYQENWSFDSLYPYFPGADGLTNSSNASLSQSDRLTGNLLSTETGVDVFNRISQTANTPNLPLVLASNLNSNPGTLNNPPQPLGSPALTGGTNNLSVVDTRFNTDPNDPRSALNVNTLYPYVLPSNVNPSTLTGDIVHRYWQEQFQIAGAGRSGGSDFVTQNSGRYANAGFITWSDNPGLVMSYYDATNLPEGLLAQQYTMCDNYFHSAFGGSFLNHQFLIAAQGPVYDNMPAFVDATHLGNSGNLTYLDANGLLVLNDDGPSAGKQVRDGAITPVAGDQMLVTLNGTPSTVVTVAPENTEAFSGGPGTTYDKHYVVNTTRSRNLPSGTDAFPTNVGLLPSQNDSNPTNDNGDTRPYIPNIGDLLSANNISWKWYSGQWSQIAGFSPANDGSNPLYPALPAAGYAAANAQYQFQYHHQPFAFYDNYAPFGAGIVPAQYVGGFAGAGTGGLTPGQANVTQAQNSAAHLQDETNFFADVQAGTLPAVVFIKPVGINNEHPGYAALQTGQAHVASIVQALQANPAVWAHTAVIVTYDEHGGRWDHVTPPQRDIWGPGVRVPAIVISPLAKRGYVDHTQRDTSSILSTIEQRFGLPSLNARDAAAPSFANDLTSIQIVRGGYSLNRRTNKITQAVTVSNLSSNPIAGPVNLVLDGLSGNTALVGGNGITGNNPPNGSPYVVASAGDLAAGASVVVTLTFNVPSSGSISYSPRTVTGTPNP